MNQNGRGRVKPMTLLAIVVAMVLGAAKAPAQTLPDMVPDLRRDYSPAFMMDMDSSPNGYLWVATGTPFLGGTVRGYTAEGVAFANFATAGFAPGAIACLSDSVVVVIEAEGGGPPCPAHCRVYRYNGVEVRPRFSFGIGSSECITDAAIGPDSLLYILALNAEITAYDLDTGQLDHTISMGPFTSPSAFAFDRNGVLIVAVTEAEGESEVYRLRRMRPSDGFVYGDIPIASAPKAIACDLSGDIHAVYAPHHALNQDKVTVYAQGGAVRLDQVIRSPHAYEVAAVATDARCGVFLAIDSSSTKFVRRFEADKDGDGLCDTWEIDGLEAGFGQANWNLPGAQVLHKDLYLEVDAMDGFVPAGDLILPWIATSLSTAPSDSMTPPNPDGAPGISLHAFLDETMPAVGFRKGFWASQFDSLKRLHFGTSADRSQGDALVAAKERVYRYCIFADTISRENSTSKRIQPLGLAKNFQCRDFVVALGRVNWTPGPGGVVVGGTVIQQASVLMHELGHAIGLRHGGKDDLTHKPNYRSVMSYIWSTPTAATINKWRLSYSDRPYLTLDEACLDETAGIGGQPGDSTRVPYKGRPRDMRWVSEVGPVDWNEEGGFEGCSQAPWIDRNPATSVLTSYSDWPYVRLSPAKNDTIAQPGVMDEPSLDDVDQLAGEYCDCNENGLSDWRDILDGLSADANVNAIPDECERERVTVQQTLVIGCPGGNAGGINLQVDLANSCLFDTVAMPGLNDLGRVHAVLRSGVGSTVRLWAGDGTELDTLRASAFEVGTEQYFIGHGRISGHGTIWFDGYVDDLWVGRSPDIVVRTYDFDDAALGACDRFDRDSLASHIGHGGHTWLDFDEDGQITLGDVDYLEAHVGHAITRVLTAPNGGESYNVGMTLPITWMPGLGDSARVTLRLLKDSVPGYAWWIANDVMDTGSYDWIIPGWLPGGNDCRVLVIHTAGYYGVDGQDVGADFSNNVFSITGAGGGGCPFAETRTSTGWQVENSILGRSVAGTLSADAYRLKALPQIIEGRIQVRIVESEQEYTTVDRASVIAVEHASDVRAYAVKDRILVGTRIPAHRVTTSSGRDITTLVNGTGDYYWGGPGDTLLVEMRAPRKEGAFGASEAEDGGGGEGGLEGDPKVMEKADRGTRADPSPMSGRSVDADILASTGILIEVPDGSGGWRRLADYYPRHFRDETVVDSLGAGNCRLIFVGRHRLHFIGRYLRAATSPTPLALSLLTARHSRLGDSKSAVAQSGGATTALVPGDTLTLEFATTAVPSGLVRDYFLVSRGVYSSAPPAQGQEGEPDEGSRPSRFALAQNIPNPFGQMTTIHFELPIETSVRLEIFDAQGRQVRVLADGTYPAGFHAVDWDHRSGGGQPLGPGVYLYRIQAGTFRDRKKMVLLAR